MFLNEIGSGTHSGLKFGRRGGGASYINAMIKKSPGMRPSEKELKGAFRHKSAPGYNLYNSLQSSFERKKIFEIILGCQKPTNEQCGFLWRLFIEGTFMSQFVIQVQRFVTRNAVTQNCQVVRE
jgi:hypothetical protein